MAVKAVVFDVGNVLYHWSPRTLYERLIPDDQALDAFLAEVVTPDWHFQHDAGRPFAETSAELIARYPQHRTLIEAWGPRFNESVSGPVAGMHALVDALDRAEVPIFGITNFSGEFWPAFRAQEAHLFDRFRDVVVSGDERLVKPDPAIYALALDRFELEPGEGMFIDDNLANVEAARKNGFVAHHFRDAQTLSSELSRLGIL
jgi:2-haloacid dehalogenase